MKQLNRFFVQKMVMAAVISFFFLSSKAQYYYRDIMLTAQSGEQQQLYKKNRIAYVQLHSYEADSSPSENFECKVVPNGSFTQIRTYTNSTSTGISSLSAYYNFRGMLYKSVDSTADLITTYTYIYDSTGKLYSATSVSSSVTADKKKSISEGETHIWHYTSDGYPFDMLYINNEDTTVVKFKLDDAHNIIEEESWFRNVSKGKTYYYYDDLNRLTDIVRFNPRLQRLMPDYIFEYDTAGKISRMITVQPGGNDYLTWLYTYNEKSLKTEERCYNKQKRLLGKITYEYGIRGKE